MYPPSNLFHLTTPQFPFPYLINQTKPPTSIMSEKDLSKRTYNYVLQSSTNNEDGEDYPSNSRALARCLP